MSKKKIRLAWKVTKNVQAACPDFVPDPYTGEYPNTHCAVLHWKQVEEMRSKEFDSKKEAEEFKKNAPRECTDFRYV
jgi:hypothetical protein